jgi:hypothetical protein
VTLSAKQFSARVDDVAKSYRGMRETIEKALGRLDDLDARIGKIEVQDRAQRVTLNDWNERIAAMRADEVRIDR